MATNFSMNHTSAIVTPKTPQEILLDRCERQAEFAASMGNAEFHAAWQARGMQVIAGKVSEPHFATWLFRFANDMPQAVDAEESALREYCRSLARTMARE